MPNNSSADDVGGKLNLGHISAASGIKGWVKVHSDTSPRENIFTYQPWYLMGADGGWRPVELVSSRPQGKTLVAKLAGCDTRNDAEALIGARIAVDRGVLPELGNGDFYWRELIGMVVVNQEGDHLGVVASLLETGANDVLVLHPDAESIDSEQRLIPYVFDHVVLDVSKERAEIKVAWPRDF